MLLLQVPFFSLELSPCHQAGQQQADRRVASRLGALLLLAKAASLGLIQAINHDHDMVVKHAHLRAREQTPQGRVHRGQDESGALSQLLQGVWSQQSSLEGDPAQ